MDISSSILQEVITQRVNRGRIEMKGRAETAEDKKAIIQRIMVAWLSKPNLRLGQLLENALPVEDDLFYMEDDVLIGHLERYVRK